MPNYKITYPSKSYPSTAPYSNLSIHFKHLVREGLMHRTIIKALLYPDFYTKININNVRLRRQMHAQSYRRRESIGSSRDLSPPNTESNEFHDDNTETGTSITSSIGFVRFYTDKNSKISSESHGTFVDHGPNAGAAVDCTRDIFAGYNDSNTNRMNETVPVIRDSDGSYVFSHENAESCDIGTRDSLKYYSKPVKVVIDRNQSCRTDSLIHTTTAELVLGNNGAVATNKGSPTDDLSEMSGFHQRTIRANMACEDLVNLDDSMKIKNDKDDLCKKPSVTDERHSMPNLFVGNRFNCSSLTEVYIPSYQDKREIQLTIENDGGTQPQPIDVNNDDIRNSQLSTVTHSSSFDIPALMPAPDQLSTELLYNSEQPIKSDGDSESFVIKPPSMFDGHRSLSRELSPFVKHAINSDKKVISRRPPSTSQNKDKRCVSYHYINLQSDAADDMQLQRPNSKVDGETRTPQMDVRKCGCCAVSPCHSPRSSDSGMAGSCTISSPDAPILNIENEYEPFDDDFLSENQNRMNSLMHSQSSHNFGRFNEIPFRDNNHDSGQYGHCNDEPETEQQIRDSAINNMFELSLSRDTVKRQSRCQSAERSTEHSKQLSERTPNKKALFKTGLYAHWWKKELLPSDLLRDIYRLKENQRSERDRIAEIGETSQSNNNWGSGKIFFLILSRLWLFFF